MTAPIRAFIALPLSQDAFEKTKRIQDRLRARLGSDSIRWTPADQLHLTIKFLGEIDPASVDLLTRNLTEQCGQTPALRLSLARLGCFPSFMKPNVIWIGIGGDVAQLRDLAARTELATKEIGQHDEDREFHPHLTIGRLRPGGRKLSRSIGAKLQAEPAPPEVEWTVSEVILFRSELKTEGAVHVPIATVRLT
jgi:2'-5' RNA ligase